MIKNSRKLITENKFNSKRLSKYEDLLPKDKKSLNT